MCGFCLHGFEIVTVIERDGARRQAARVHMLGKASDSADDGCGGGSVQRAAPESTLASFPTTCEKTSGLLNSSNCTCPCRSLITSSANCKVQRQRDNKGRTSGKQDAQGRRRSPKDPAGSAYLDLPAAAVILPFHHSRCEIRACKEEDFHSFGKLVLPADLPLWKEATDADFLPRV